jgi:hypothetical protein
VYRQTRPETSAADERKYRGRRGLRAVFADLGSFGKNAFVALSRQRSAFSSCCKRDRPAWTGGWCLVLSAYAHTITAPGGDPVPPLVKQRERSIAVGLPSDQGEKRSGAKHSREEVSPNSRGGSSKPSEDGQELDLGLMDPSDHDLIARFRAGEAEAFADLVRRWERRVYGLAYRVTGDATEASDIRQMAFMRA